MIRLVPASYGHCLLQDFCHPQALKRLLLSLQCPAGAFAMLLGLKDTTGTLYNKCSPVQAAQGHMHEHDFHCTCVSNCMPSGDDLV